MQETACASCFRSAAVKGSGETGWELEGSEIQGGWRCLWLLMGTIQKREKLATQETRAIPGGMMFFRRKVGVPGWPSS